MTPAYFQPQLAALAGDAVGTTSEMVGEQGPLLYWRERQEPAPQAMSFMDASSARRPRS